LLHVQRTQNISKEIVDVSDVGILLYFTLDYITLLYVE